ncbi:MAG: energy-coupling factor transporter transmembrane component T family protein [Candidatus Binatia bacterium]
MPLFLYIDRPTALHRLNPIAKVLGMLCLFVAAFVGQEPLALLPLAGAIAVLIVQAGAFQNVRRLRVLFILVFIMTFLIWSLFFRGGVAVVSWGPVRISGAGCRFALGMAIKLDIFLGVGVLFLSTTKIEEFAYALTRVGVPYKLGFTMTLAFRLVPVFLEAAMTVVEAQRCRGFNFDEGNLVQRMRRYVPVIVPVFIGALRKADGMAMALEARGFQARRPRTTFEQFSFGAGDTIALLLTAAAAAGYVALWWRGAATVLPA